MKKLTVGILTIFILTLSILSIGHVNSEIGNDLYKINESTEFIQFYSTQQNDSVIINDYVILKTNNLEILDEISNVGIIGDSVSVSDSVVLAKNIVLVNSPSKIIAIPERTFKGTKSSNVSYHQSFDELIFDDLSLTHQNKITENENYSILPYLTLIELNSLSNNNLHFTENEIISVTSIENWESILPLLIIAPLSSLFLVKSINPQIRSSTLHKSIVYFLVIVLVSSTISTPLAISQNYWGIVYAEEFSFDGIIEDSKNNLESNSTSTEPITTGINSTSTEPITTGINSTSTEPITTGINSTSTELIIIPEATASFEFDNPELESVDITNATSTQESTTLELDGQGDFLQIQNVTSTNNLNSLTVTAWVKPDYSLGSPEFTVLSKDKSFSLTINNNNQQENIAKFSVFDGIKWTTVESTSVITEDWSFLSSTFNGESISIFVNGTKEGTKEIVGVPTLAINGKLETTAVENISSEEDIVIGASLTTKDNTSKPSNQFSGEIDDVLLYDSVLDDEQIRSMYEQTKDTYASLVVSELSLEEILSQIIEEQNLNSTSTNLITSNSTLINPIILEITPLDVTPKLDSTDDSYLITQDAETILEFYDESDVLLNEIEELENSLLLLEELEETLDEIDAGLIESETTIIDPIFGFINILIPFANAASQTAEEDSRSEITNTKQQIQNLKDKFTTLKATNSLDEQTTKDLKTELKSLLAQLKQTTQKISQTSEADKGKSIEDKTLNIENISDLEDNNTVQSDNWNGAEEQITVSIYDAKGDHKNISTQIEKLRDGKFYIKFSPDTDTKPGLYKIVTTLVVNGQEYSV